MNYDADEPTKLLQDWSAGDRGALERLIPLVFEDLRKIAQRQCRRERMTNTLQPMDLVSEVYIRLADQKTHCYSLRQFFSVVALLMQRILIDAARYQLTIKRGGSVNTISLEEIVALPADNCNLGLPAIRDALSKLEEVDSRQKQIVELRFFVGLTQEEIGEELEVSVSTVKREWKIARLWLSRELTEKHIERVLSGKVLKRPALQVRR